MKTLYESIMQFRFTRREIDESILDSDERITTKIETPLKIIKFVVYIIKSTMKNCYVKGSNIIIPDRGIIKQNSKTNTTIYQTDILYQLIIKKIRAELNHERKTIDIPVTKQIYIGIYPSTENGPTFTVSLFKKGSNVPDYTLIRDYFKHYIEQNI